MNNSFKFLAIGATSLIFGSSVIHAQDGPPPPPQGGADYNYQGGPGPQGPQGAPPPDQGGPQGGPDQGDDQGASFQQFYDQLGSQGNWVQTQDYGYVFQPNVSDPNWAPYSNGHWVYSDVGWTWVSAEPWGWATYHYGRWANIDGAGWVWVPGYEWAPAWVSWRYGGGYCGWAPLPPATFVGVDYGGPGVAVGIGFHFGGDVDLNFNIGPGCYNFVPVGCMGYGNYNRYYLDRSRNYTVINHTTNITNITINNNRAGGTSFTRISNRGHLSGPTLSDINAHSTQQVQRVTLARANQAGRADLHGNLLSVYAPRVNASAAHDARPAHVGETLNNVSFNHGDSINKPLDVTRSIHGRAASPEAVAEAQKAVASAPATARVAHEGVAHNAAVDRPITSLQPVSELRRTQPATAPQAGGAVNGPAMHTAASPYTGEPATTQHKKSATENSALTGQPSSTTQQHTHQTNTSPYTGQGGPVHQPAQRTTETSPYTGEPAQQHSTVQHGAVGGTTVPSVNTSQHQTADAEREAARTRAQENAVNAIQRRDAQAQQQQSVQHGAASQGGGAPVQHSAAPVQHSAAPVQHTAAPQGAPAQHAAPQGQGGGHPAGAQGKGNPNDNGQGR